MLVCVGTRNRTAGCGSSTGSKGGGNLWSWCRLLQAALWGLTPCRGQSSGRALLCCYLLPCHPFCAASCWRCAVLCCAVLCCAVLCQDCSELHCLSCCSVMCCAVCCCAVLCCAAMCCAMQCLMLSGRSTSPQCFVPLLCQAVLSVVGVAGQ